MGWSQEELALVANIDRSYVGAVERGQRNLTSTVLCRLCEAMWLRSGLTYPTTKLLKKHEDSLRYILIYMLWLTIFGRCTPRVYHENYLEHHFGEKRATVPSAITES